MSGRHPATPVGSNGLRAVGSPNRIAKRAAKKNENLNSPSFQSPQRNSNLFDTPASETGRSSFADRVYRINGSAGRSTDSGSLFASPGSPPGNSTPFSMDSSTTDPFRTPLQSAPIAEQELPTDQIKSTRKRALPEKPAKPALSTPGIKGVQSAAPGKTEDSVVPSSIIDHPSQRLYALSIIALLVAWKTYDALKLSFDGNKSSLFLFLKWALLDILVSFFGVSLRIPRLTFAFGTMAALAIVAVFIDLNLFLLPESVFVLVLKPLVLGVASNCARSLKSIPIIGPRLVGDSELLIDSFELDGSHILGRHTIHVLPHSLARMNPTGKCFCIDESTTKSEPWYWRYTSSIITHHHGHFASIPIIINGTQPSSIVYSHTSFDTGERKVHAIKNIASLRVEPTMVYPTLGKWVLATYYIPTKEPGAYELVGVKDEKGLDFRTATKAPPTIIVTCPKAKLQWNPNAANIDKSFVIDSTGDASICQRVSSDISFDTVGSFSDGESSDTGYGDLVEVVAEGYEPLEISIVRLVNGEREEISLNGIQPRVLEGSVLSTNSKELSEQQLSMLDALSKYRTRHLTYTLTEAFLRPGEYVYKLERACDACNHTLRSPDQMRFNGDNAPIPHTENQLARIHVHKRPSAKWATSSIFSDSPLRISDDRQRKSSYKLPLRLSGEGPWAVEYNIIDGDNVASYTAKFKTSNNAAINANLPGIYRLVSVADANCKGPAESTNVTLAQTSKPEVVIKANPIMARECGGEIGAQVELEFSGRPPFAVYYYERNQKATGNNQQIMRTVRTNANRHAFRITPEVAGSYEFEFFRLDDDNYPSGRKISHIVKQSVHAQPTAKLEPIGGTAPSRACMGQSLGINVKLTGQGPWSLIYKIIHNREQESHEIQDITDPNYKIDAGPFTEPGIYTIEVSQVKDGNSCVRELQDVSTDIHVREGGPRIGFQCPGSGIRALDGSAVKIPLQISSGEPPIHIKYRRVSGDSEKMYEATIPRGTIKHGQPSFIPAYEPGSYELVEVSDYCMGTIDAANSRCTVHVEPKPRAWLITDNLNYNEFSSYSHGVWRLKDTCEGAVGASGGISLGLDGLGPWEVEYTVDYWKPTNPNIGNLGYADKHSKHTLVALKPTTIKVGKSEPGLYRYSLKTVRDQRYQTHQPLLQSYGSDNNERNQDITVVEHVVTGSPMAALRAYLPDGTALNPGGRTPSSFYRRTPRTIKHCLAPGQTTSEGDAQAWAKVREHLPVFRIEFDKQSQSPPFTAWIEVFPSSGPSEVIEIDNIQSYLHSVTLPDYITSKIGRYHMRLVKTRDSNGCEHEFVSASLVGLGRSDSDNSRSIEGGIEIEYIEAPTARPSPSSPAAAETRDVCVGDVLAFDLRGVSSWNIEYEYNGARRTASTSKRVFRKLVDSTGNFTLARICHRAVNACCSDFGASLEYSVHEIPRVVVSGGKDVHQDIVEGDMVKISMELVGTPPFTFSWQRRDLDRDLGGTGKILESHTVKDFGDHVYSITASSEGIFEVTYIQDKYCQYPKS